MKNEEKTIESKQKDSSSDNLQTGDKTPPKISKSKSKMGSKSQTI